MTNLIAQGITNPLVTTTPGETGIQYLQNLISKVVFLAFTVGTLIFFFMLITGAIQWMASSGDKASVEAARGKIANAIIGLVILFSIIALVKVIETLFNVNILQIDLGPLQIT